jgi:hypothetical protein
MMAFRVSRSWLGRSSSSVLYIPVLCGSRNPSTLSQVTVRRVAVDMDAGVFCCLSSAFHDALGLVTQLTCHEFFTAQFGHDV